MNSVSVVLPTKNNEDEIASLLTAIFSQKFDGFIEVIILDSSDDGTPEIARTYSEQYNVTIVRVEPEEYNYGGTRNFGASLSKGEYLIFISTDVIIRDENWLTNLITKLKDPTVAGVYGRQLPKEHATIMEEYFIQQTYPDYGKVYSININNEIDDLFFSNTNSAIKKDVWKKIPLPKMLMSEDQEWAKKALLSGYKIIYEPSAVVYHSHNYSFKQVFKRYFDSGATLPYVYNTGIKLKNNFLKKAIDYELSQIRYICKKNSYKVIPRVLLYEIVKVVGFVIGSKYRYVPNNIRMKISYNKNHWKKYDKIVI